MAAKTSKTEQRTGSATDRNAKTSELCHPATSKVSEGTKQSRSFIPITSIKQWRKQKV